MKGRDEIRELIVAEYLRGDVSLRDLARKHGISHSTLGRWVRAEGRTGACDDGRQTERDLAVEVKLLKQDLRQAELHAKLLDAMIDIAEERFNIPIRKKSGPRR